VALGLIRVRAARARHRPTRSSHLRIHRRLICAGGEVVLRVVVCGVVLVMSCVVLFLCCSCRVVCWVVLVVCLCV